MSFLDPGIAGALRNFTLEILFNEHKHFLTVFSIGLERFLFVNIQRRFLLFFCNPHVALGAFSEKARNLKAKLSLRE